MYTELREHIWICNDNLNNMLFIRNYRRKAMKFDCIDHKNVNPRTNLNKRRLYLNRSRAHIIFENFLTFFRNIIKCLNLDLE